MRATTSQISCTASEAGRHGSRDGRARRLRRVAFVLVFTRGSDHNFENGSRSVSTSTLPYESVIDKAHRQVIFASSLGTVFEWYDFYLYGSLAAIISKQFFSGVNETTAFIFALMAFAAGFAVRPFGALVFGRLGDMVGRKHTFLITIVIMGLSTALVGMLPDYASIGVMAPIALVGLRLLPGLALRTAGGASIPAGSRRRPPWACS